MQKYEELNYRRQNQQERRRFCAEDLVLFLDLFSLSSFACAEKLNHKEISMTFMAKHISVSINRPAAQVYEFASNPENLPKWAAGLSGSIKKVDEGWIADSPMGRVKIKFAENNKLGVLDHDVTLPSGVKVYNPMRVFPNNDGSEVVFTLYHWPGVLDQEFAEDANAVEKDLAKLKTLLEK
jgi:Polyketide cyclase / dehydrase and lipid transport